MGWTETHKRPGISMTEFFIEHGVLRWSDPDATYKVLDSALIRMHTYYAAVERTETNGNRSVFAVVILVKMFNGRRGRRDRWDHCAGRDFNICYKEMDESAGPNESECPEKILKLLTPTASEWANEWRARCWEHIATKKARPKITIGTILKYGEKFYEVTKCLGAKGYIVDGYMRMRRTQAANATILQERPNA